MARPKADTKEGKIAAEKWRKTMIEKYGSVTAKMQEAGRIGGKISRGGGFCDREFAKKMGSLGGLISKKGTSYKEQWEKYGAEAFAMYDSGEYSMADIARKFNLPYSIIKYRISKMRKGNEK